MSGQIGEFIAKVIKTLNDHGYPKNKVALPLEKMYEQAAKQGYSFNKVLDFLKEKEGIDHEKTAEKIIFFPVTEQYNAGAAEGSWLDANRIAEMMGGIDPTQLNNLNFGGIMHQAAELLKNMPSDQLSKIKSMVEGMSEEERTDLMEKIKKFGFPS
jgi:hypothetical protein